METNVKAQEVSVVDALLTIYRQQDERVRRDFLVRVRQEDRLLDMEQPPKPKQPVFRIEGRCTKPVF
jgi:hypothetical protein